jgi:hypothetical protein
METRYNLIDILTTDYDLIKKIYIGKQPIMVIKNNSETIEDRFQDQILYIVENYYDHYNNDYNKELDFINHLLRTKLQPKQYKQVQTIEYCDNYDNLVIDNYTDSYKEYYDKLQLLLIHYQPEKH